MAAVAGARTDGPKKPGSYTGSAVRQRSRASTSDPEPSRQDRFMSRRERQRRRRRNRGSPLFRVFALTTVLILSVVVVGLLAVAGWVVNVAQSAPDLTTLKPVTPGSPSQVFAANGTSLGYIWSPDIHNEVSATQIPQIVKEATIAIEDRRFYQHGALDYQGIVRAAIKDAFNGGTPAGRLDADHAAGRQRLPAPAPARPARPQVQDHPGQAGRAAGGKAPQELDPDQLSQRRPLRHGRRSDLVRRRGRLQDVLQQAGPEAEPGPGGAAGRPAAGALPVQPVHRRRRRPPAPRRGPAGDGHSRLHHPGPGQRRRPQAPGGQEGHHLRGPPAAVRVRLHPAGGGPGPVPPQPRPLPDAHPRRAEDLHHDRSAQAGPGQAGDPRQRVDAGRAGRPGRGRRRTGLDRPQQRPHPGDRVFVGLQPDDV